MNTSTRTASRSASEDDPESQGDLPGMPASPELPAVEAGLEGVLDALGVPAVLLAANGDVRHANERAGRCVGRAPEELAGLTGQDWEELLRECFIVSAPREPDPDDPEARVECLESVGGRRRAFERVTRPVRQAGAPAGCLQILRDVTDLARAREERRRLEAQFARESAALQARLEQIENYKLELTANVTHDLRTPLASIKASVSGLLAGDIVYDPQVLRETLTVIEQETDRLQRRVQNLLSMSRMESGDATVTRDWVDVADILASALESLRSIQNERRVQVSFPDDLPLVLADYDQVLIAVRNLIENAFLYSPPDEPVEVSASVSLGQIRIRVRDRGAGLMPDEFERVFDKFYRGRSARRIPGTGLGLPICRGIAEAHGGSLWAEHVPGGGVAFVLSLPLEPNEPDPGGI